MYTGTYAAGHAVNLRYKYQLTRLHCAFVCVIGWKSFDFRVMVFFFFCSPRRPHGERGHTDANL